MYVGVNMYKYYIKYNNSLIPWPAYLHILSYYLVMIAILSCRVHLQLHLLTFLMFSLFCYPIAITIFIFTLFLLVSLYVYLFSYEVRINCYVWVLSLKNECLLLNRISWVFLLFSLGEFELSFWVKLCHVLLKLILLRWGWASEVVLLFLLS